MEKMGFCPKWRTLVMQCVSTVQFSILINGERVGNIIPSRGIRQGDPISPYLFLLCAEGFSSLLRSSNAEGCLHGIKPSFRGPTVSHLLFADDSLIFSRATVEEAKEISRILDLYESVSGQRINLDKSLISFNPCVKQEIKATIRDILNLHSPGSSYSYLGLPSIIGRSKKEVFDLVRERVWKRARSWKEKFLSRAGKEVMLKSVLQSVPIYVMGVFRLPEDTCNVIHSIFRNFCWGNSIDKRPLCWRN